MMFVSRVMKFFTAELLKAFPVLLQIPSLPTLETFKGAISNLEDLVLL